MYGDIREQKDLPDELTTRIDAEIRRFKENFAVREETALPGAA